MGVWPFLISRSRDVDYQVILSPDFMVRRNRDQLIKKILRTKAQEITPELRLEEVKEPGFENLHIAYKSEVATLAGEELRDRAGRRILRVYGFVIEDPSLSAYEQEISRFFSKASPEWESTLGAFWKDNVEREPIASTDLLARDAPPWPWKAATAGLAAALAISILANAWLYFEMRKRGVVIRTKDREIARLNAAGTQISREPKGAPEQPEPATGGAPVK